MAIVLSACLNPESSESPTTSFTSSWVKPEDPQEQIGAREHPLVVAKYGGEYINPTAERMLAVIVGDLVAQSADPGRVYRITILDSPKVNAFALPGGYLYITRGLLSVANDSSEIASVIAHEMAHVAANHAILRQQKRAGNAFGERVVNEVLGDSSQAKLALAAGRLQLSQFSREQEYQADAIGIRTAGKAGYDPFASARFLASLESYRTLSKKNRSRFGRDSIFASHPSTPRRIELARGHARFFGAPGVGKKGRDRYLMGIDGLRYGDSPAEGFVRNNVFAHSGLGIRFSAPEGYIIDNQSKAVVISGPGDLAIRFDATILGKHKNLKDYISSGWINGLDQQSIKQTKNNGLTAVSANATAENWKFRIWVIRNGNQLYRFIAASSSPLPLLIATTDQVAKSFRKLTRDEIKKLQPLKIKIVTRQKGQSMEDIAGKMVGGRTSNALFYALNGLQPGASVPEGTKLKVVVE